jgi:hypothetical protein
MSRLTIALALVASLSTTALADRAAPTMNFAQPPADSIVASPARFDRAAIRAKLAQNRVANLARFRVYQRKGVFPNNTFADGKLNVWLDANGNFCAAATIIKLSGNDDLAQRTADQDNFIKLGDVTQGPLMDWILTSGLTQAEIAAIQEPFSRFGREPTPVLVDAKLRSAEDRRLAAKYKQVDARVVKQQEKSLDIATARLLAHPDLAASFLAH